MREGLRNENDEPSVGNILLSSQRTTCIGRVGGAALSDSTRFSSNFGFFRLRCLFVFSWSILTLLRFNLQLLPILLKEVLDVCTHRQATIWFFIPSPPLFRRSSLRFFFFRVIVGILLFLTCLFGWACHSAITRKPV